MSPRERESSSLPTNDSFASIEALQESYSTSKNAVRHVRFGSIQIRDYNRVVGDHPDVKVGPPVALSWDYTERPSQDLDDYETTRLPFKRVLRMTSITRKNMLRTIFDIPEEEIAAAEKEVQKIRSQRASTTQQSKTSATVESVAKRTGRKLRKGLLRSIAASSHLMAGPMALSMQA